MKEAFWKKPSGKTWAILLLCLGVMMVLAYPIYAAFRNEPLLYSYYSPRTFFFNQTETVDGFVPLATLRFGPGITGRALYLNFTDYGQAWIQNRTNRVNANRHTINVFNSTFGNRTYEFWIKLNNTGDTPDDDGYMYIGTKSTGFGGILFTKTSDKLRLSSSFALNNTLSATAYQAKRIDVGDTFWTSRGLIAYWPFNGSGNATHFKEFANGGASYWAKRIGNDSSYSWKRNGTYGYYPYDNSTNLNRVKVMETMNISYPTILNRSRGSIMVMIKVRNMSRTAGSIIQQGETNSPTSTGSFNITTLGIKGSDGSTGNNNFRFTLDRKGYAGSNCGLAVTRRFEVNQWYLVVATWNSSDATSRGYCEVWVNGSLVGIDTSAYIPENYGAGQYEPRTMIGRSPADPKVSFINATIDELAIFAQQLNQSDIQKIAWSNFSDNQWHHVAMEHGVYGGKGNIGYFVDGRKYAQWNNTNTTHKTPVEGKDLFYIGCGPSCADPSRNILLDNLRISNITRYGFFNSSFSPKSNLQGDGRTMALFTFDYLANQTTLRFCTNANQYNESVAVNFSFYDEINQTKFNITKWESSFTLQNVRNLSDIFRINLTRINSPRHISLCLTPSSNVLRTNASIKATKNGFNYRNWYYDSRKDNFTGYRKNESIYLLQDTKATLISILMTDSLDSPLTDILTGIERYYISNNSWYTIAWIKAGEDGKDAVYLQQNEVDYRFRVFQDGKQVKLTTGQKLTAATYTIKIVPSSLTDLISNIGSLDTNLTYNNHTKTFKYGFYDPNSIMAGACLQSSISNTTGTYFRAVNCSYGTFRGFLYSRPGNSTPSSSTGYGYIIMNGSILNFGKETLQIIQGLHTQARTWGKYGLFLLLVLIVGIVMTQIGSPISVIVALMVTLFVAWWMDVFSVTTFVFTSLMIGLGLIIKELRSG